MHPMTDLLTRDAIIASFNAEQEPLTAAALSVSYETITQEVRAYLGAEPYWALISKADRDKAASSGAAMPDGGFPVLSCSGENSVDSAIHAVGRGSAGHNAIRKHIMKRASSLGCASKIPDTWGEDGSIKSDSAAEAITAATPPPPPPAAPVAKAPPAPGAPPEKPAPDAKTPPKAGEGSVAYAEVDAGMSVHVDTVNKDIAAAIALQKTDPGTDSEAADTKVMTILEQMQALGKQLAAAQDADASENPPSKSAPAPPKTPPAADAPPANGPPASDPPPVMAEGALGASCDCGAVGCTSQPGCPACADHVCACSTMTAAGPPTSSETPGNAVGIPNDADDNGPGPGDIEADVICENPDCGHMAGVHQDDADLGGNSGACQTPGCTCPGMIPPGDQVNGPSDDTPVGQDDGGGPNNAGGDDDAPGVPKMAADFAPGDMPPIGGDGPTAPAPDAPEIEGAPAPELPPLDPNPSITVGPAFAIPVAWIEGVETGDGRMIQPGALTWRTPPLPLMAMVTSSHDPSGMSPNDPAVLVGRIEQISVEGTNGTASGHLLTTKHGMDFAQVLEQMGRYGVSIDVGDAEIQQTGVPDITLPPGASQFDAPILDVLVKGVVMAMTACPMAAFQGAYMVLGDGSNIPDAKVPPAPEGSNMAIHYVDEIPCVPCGDDSLVAAAVDKPSLLRPPGAWFGNPNFGKDADGKEIAPHLDDRLSETIDPKSGRLSGKFACPITITDDGEVFGHIAQHGVCHQSPQFLNNGQCVLAPRSLVDYAAFHGTGKVITAEGEMIGVGRMTADTGHASDSPAVDFRRALAHYDNSGLTAATVRAGEDEFGIWVHGSLHPSTSPEQVHTMRVNPPSGDWRPFGAGRELCQVLFVNHPGFPMVVADKRPATGEITRLVAAGVPCFSLPEPVALSLEERVAMMERANKPLLGLAKEQLRHRRAAIS
jgi:hypothetical protein